MEILPRHLGINCLLSRQILLLRVYLVLVYSYGTASLTYEKLYIQWLFDLLISKLSVYTTIYTITRQHCLYTDSVVLVIVVRHMNVDWPRYFFVSITVLCVNLTVCKTNIPKQFQFKCYRSFDSSWVNPAEGHKLQYRPVLLLLLVIFCISS